MFIDFPYSNYYSFDNKIYHTKLDALIAAKNVIKTSNNINSVLKFHLPKFESNLDNINCLEEPEESLDFLYLERAKQLRNKYPYLILYYSGGSDSHNILETFMLNNIFLDEIVILNTFDTSTKNNWQINNPEYFYFLTERFEVENSAIPLAKYMVETYSPKTKITYIDNIFKKNKKYLESISEYTFLEMLKSHIEPILNHRNLLRVRAIHEYNKNFDKLEAAHIYGNCKPTVYKDIFGFYLFYQDSTINARCDPYFQGNSNYVNELFYIHPSTIKLQIKQAHLLLKNNFTDYHIIRDRAGEDKMAEVLYKPKLSIPYKGIKHPDLLKDKNMKKYLTKILSETNPIVSEFIFLQQLQRDIDSVSIANISSLKQNIYNSFFKNSNITENDMNKYLTQSVISRKFYIKWI